MGQTIEIDEAIELGDVLLISTDRSLTGQDGESYVPGIITDDKPNVSAQLAQRLFDSDSKVDHVYVMSNAISIRRPGGWDEGALEVSRQTVSNFFRFYTSHQTEGGGS